MSSYLYKTIIYERIPVGSDEDKLDSAMDDFINNQKSSATRVDGLSLSETTFIIEKTYDEFKALLVSLGLTFSDVQYLLSRSGYELYLLASEPV